MSSTLEVMDQRIAPAPESPSAESDQLESSLVTVIEKLPSWQLVNVRELWRFRELLFFLTWRDIKVRYKQTVLGAAWAVLQPLATMVVFSLFFGGGAHAQDPIPYPLFVFAGLLPWFFLSNSILAASNSVVSNQQLVTKIYFPRLLIPVGATGPFLIDFAVSFVILLGMMVYYQRAPTWEIVLIPFLGLGLLMTILGVGTLLSALTVAYRDFRHVVPFTIQLWMFATPSIYLSADAIANPTWKALLPLNPAYGLILNFRAAVLGRPFDFYALAVSCAVGVFFLVFGAFYFRRVEKTFADII